VIVRFDRLFPAISSQSSVPMIGNVMTSRWAYEAMAVHQFRNNDFNSQFFEFDQTRKYCGWKKDYWIKEMLTKVNEAEKWMTDPTMKEQLVYNLELLSNEFEKEKKYNSNFNTRISTLSSENLTTKILAEMEGDLMELEQYYILAYNEANSMREKKIGELTATPEWRQAYLSLQDAHFNESLEDFVTNKNDLKKIVEYNKELVQKQNLAYLTPQDKGLFGAHFYAPSKEFFGKQITTLSANVLVIWMMTFVLGVILFLDGLKRSANWIESRIQFIKEKLTKRP